MDYISKIKLGDTTYQIKDSDAMHSGDGDTKNTTGTTNKANTKLFLAGAESQGANPVTYSNVNCYIGTDNCLYSGGSKVLTSHDGNTLNTAGASNKASTKLFLVGATAQTDGIQSYSNVNCYVGTDNCLYSNGSKVLTSYTNTTYAAGTGVTITGSNNAINVTYGTAANTACQGNDSRLSNSRPASDVSAWAKASTKPSYTLAEVGATASVVAITAATSSTCSITGSGNAGKSETIIYTNGTSRDLVVTVPTTYVTDTGAALELTAKTGGYCEVNYLNIGGTIYARGL